MFLNRLLLRALTVLAVVALTLLVIFATSDYESETIDHVVQPELFKIDFSGYGADPTREDIEKLCSQHGFKAHPETRRHRKIHDLILLGTEYEWLEIRLHSLSRYVDRFIIIEAPKTAAGLPKPIYLRRDWEKFTPFHHQLSHFVIGGEFTMTASWENEDVFRNTLLDTGLQRLIESEHAPSEDDFIVVGSVDEIPRPEAMVLLRNCKVPDRITLVSQWYLHSFEWLYRGKAWLLPHATVFHGRDGTVPPSGLRNGQISTTWSLPRLFERRLEQTELQNAGWHCSWCFSTIREMHTEMQNPSYEEWNTEENREPSTIVDRVRQVLDIFGRNEYAPDWVEGNRDVPRHVLENAERFKHLLNRSGEDAAFLDFKPQQI